MKDQLHNLISFIPFFSMAVQTTNSGEHPARSVFVRLAEAAIIGGVVLYGSVHVNTTRIADMKDNIAEIKASQQALLVTVVDLKVEVAKLQGMSQEGKR